MTLTSTFDLNHVTVALFYLILQLIYLEILHNVFPENRGRLNKLIRLYVTFCFSIFFII